MGNKSSKPTVKVKVTTLSNTSTLSTATNTVSSSRSVPTLSTAITAVSTSQSVQTLSIATKTVSTFPSVQKLSTATNTMSASENVPTLSTATKTVSTFPSVQKLSNATNTVSASESVPTLSTATKTVSTSLCMQALSTTTNTVSAPPSVSTLSTATKSVSTSPSVPTLSTETNTASSSPSMQPLSTATKTVPISPSTPSLSTTTKTVSTSPSVSTLSATTNTVSTSATCTTLLTSVTNTTAVISASTIVSAISTTTRNLSGKQHITGTTLTTSPSVQHVAYSHSTQSSVASSMPITTTNQSSHTVTTKTSSSIQPTTTFSISTPATSFKVQPSATIAVSTPTTSLIVTPSATHALSTPKTSHSVMATVTCTTASATTSASVQNVDIKQEETNYLRLTALVLKIAPRALRQLFDMHISPNNLGQKLNEQCNKDKLKKLKERRVINQEQWNCMYPHSGRVSSTDFDLTLMIVLLKEICGIVSPPNGWSKLPHVNDYCEGAEIARISLYRNKVIHGSRFFINNYNFNSTWSDIKKILIRVGGQGFTAEIDALLVCSLDQSYAELYKELHCLKTEPRYPPSIQEITQEETNYLRLTALVLKIAPRALRHLFDMHISPNNLGQKLNDQCNKDKLKKLKERRVIYQEQWNCMYPPSGRVSSTDFDLTLMLVLLKEICGIVSPPNGWNKLPHVNDYCEGAEIARISLYRNKVIHGSRFFINHYNFNSTWSDIKKTLIRVGGQGFTAEIDALFVCPLDQSYTELYKELHCLITEPRYPPSIQAYQSDKLDAWIEDDRTYVKTMATQATTHLVDSNDIVTLTGPPGSGKSSTVHHIALQLRKIGHSVHPVKTIKDITDYWIPGLDQVFVLDDPFGVHDVNTAAINDLEIYKDVLDTCFKHSCLTILMTIRLHIIQDKQMKEFFQYFRKGVVNLAAEDMTMTPADRINIFQTYARLYDRNDLLETDINQIKEFKISCFPLLCRIYAADKKSEHSVESFFRRPMIIINEEITKFQNKDPLRYVCLLLCMIYDNNLCIDILKVGVECNNDKRKREDFLEICSLSRALSRVQIESTMHSLLDTFLVKEGNTLRFMHDIIHDSVIHHVSLSSGLHELILTHCSSTFLRERVRLMSEKSNDSESYINIKEDMEPTWVGRLLKDIQDGHWLDVFSNVCLTSEYGDKLLAEQLNRLEPSSVQSLMCSAKYTKHNFPEYSVHQTKQAGRHIFRFCQPKYSSCPPCTAFHFAVAAGMKHVITNIIKRIPKSEIRNLNADINTLALGCLMNPKDVAMVLIHYGVLVNNSKQSGLPLLIALEKKTVEIAYAVLQSGDVVDICNQNGQTPLYLASSNGYDTIVKLLLEKKAYVNGCTNNGISPLYGASDKGHDTVVQLLIDNGADVNKCDNDGKSPLYIASYKGHDTVVQLLIDNGADVNKCDNVGESPLYIALYRGRNKVVQLLIDNGADVNKCDIYGESPLYIASCQGRHTVVQLLIDNGADVNKCDNVGESPLYIASYQGHETVVQLLIDNGTDVNKSKNYGESPLYIASYVGHDTVVQLLMDNGADVNKCHNDGKSPLYIALWNGHDTAVQLLIDNGADVNKCDNDGISPLYIASWKGHDTIVQLLIDNGADVNKCNNDGISPLYIASWKGHDTVVQLLIDNGADVNKCNNDGISPLNIASWKGHDTVVKLLIDNGADVNKCDNNGKSPLYIASWKGRDTVVKLLIDNGADVALL